MSDVSCGIRRTFTEPALHVPASILRPRGGPKHRAAPVRRTHSRAEMHLKHLVSQIPIETGLRRRAREGNPTASCNMDDPVLEEYLQVIHRGAKILDRSLDMRKRQTHSTPAPVEKELWFSQPGLGLSFARDVDVFGFNPMVIVKSIVPESACAGLVGVGDTLVAVDGRRTTNIPYREVMRAVADAARSACPEHPRSLTFRPVHSGPAEIAAPLDLPGLDEADEGGSVTTEEGTEDEADARAEAVRERRRRRARGGATDTETETDTGFEPEFLPAAARVELDPVEDEDPAPRMPALMATVDEDATRVRLEALPNQRRLPEMWCAMKKTEYGMYLEMEFTTPPLGILFQGRTVKGTIASSPASVLLQPGDRIMSVNGVNLESWGKLRVQDALSTLLQDMSPANPKRVQFFRPKSYKAVPNTTSAKKASMSELTKAHWPEQQRFVERWPLASPKGATISPPPRSSASGGEAKPQPAAGAGAGVSGSGVPTSPPARIPLSGVPVVVKPRGGSSGFSAETDRQKERKAKAAERMSKEAIGDTRVKMFRAGSIISLDMTPEQAAELSEANANATQDAKPDNKDDQRVVIRPRGGSAAVPAPAPVAAPAAPQAATPAPATAGVPAAAVATAASPATAPTPSAASHAALPPTPAVPAAAGASPVVEADEVADMNPSVVDGVDSFSGKLVAEELAKLTALGVAAAKAGAKAGAEAGAVAGAKAGADAGSVAAAAAGDGDATAVGAQAGASVGALAGAEAGGAAGADAGAELGRQMGGAAGEAEGRRVGQKSGAMAGAKAGSWAGAKLGASSAALAASASSDSAAVAGGDAAGAAAAST